jgi:hypothetical protein
MTKAAVGMRRSRREREHDQAKLASKKEREKKLD